MSTYGPTSCAQLRGTPPPIVKMPEPLRPEGEAGEAVQVEEGVVARQVVEELERVRHAPRAWAFFMAQVERSRPSSESVKAGT